MKLQLSVSAAFDLYGIFGANTSYQSQEKEKNGSPGPNMADKPCTLQRINHPIKAKDGHRSPATGDRAVAPIENQRVNEFCKRFPISRYLQKVKKKMITALKII